MDIFGNDKLWAFICATVIVVYAMWLKLPEAISLANIVIGGLMGAAVGMQVNKDKGG